jgi:hypothetical protein
VAAALLLGVQEDSGKEGRVECPKLQGPEAGRRFVKRRPPSDERSAVGACGVERPKEGRRGPHSHVGSACCCQEGGVGLKGGGEPQVKPASTQGKGELGDHRVPPHGSGRSVLHRVEGGEKHLPFGGGRCGGEPRPRGDAGEVGQAYVGQAWTAIRTPPRGSTNAK